MTYIVSDEKGVGYSDLGGRLQIVPKGKAIPAEAIECGLFTEESLEALVRAERLMKDGAKKASKPEKAEEAPKKSKRGKKSKKESSDMSKEDLILEAKELGLGEGRDLNKLSLTDLSELIEASKDLQNKMEANTKTK